MTGRTFGRKGGGAAVPAAPRPSFGTASARTPGPTPLRTAPSADDEMAARRAAFVAQEHERRMREERKLMPSPEALAAASVPLPERSLLAAYCLWFVGGALGAHRFYLGYPKIASAQAGLTILFAGLVIAQYYAAFVGLAAIILWAVLDGFLIESIVRKRRKQAGPALQQSRSIAPPP